LSLGDGKKRVNGSEKQAYKGGINSSTNQGMASK
jgi:hypothetical protein